VLKTTTTIPVTLRMLVFGFHFNHTTKYQK